MSSPPPLDRSRLLVLDLGTQVAGPFAATMFGDFGAEVIKIEQPGIGDPLRAPGGMSARWLVDARNKRSVTLNLRVPEGQALLCRLVERADVLVENFRPGTMARWDLGYERLAAINPRLVYVSVSGFGQSGPHAPRPAYHSIGAAFGGLSALTGFSGGPPVTPGLFLTDYLAGLFAVVGALEALRRRDASGSDGKGEWVDTALYASALRLSAAEVADYTAGAPLRSRSDTPPFTTKDGRFVTMLAVQPEQWKGVVRAFGDDRLAHDDFATVPGRQRHRARLDAILAPLFAASDAGEIVDRLVAEGVPASVVNTVADLVGDPHVAARGDLVTVDGVTMPDVVPRLVHHPGAVRWPGQALGASNRSVYEGFLGLRPPELDELNDKGVI